MIHLNVGSNVGSNVAFITARIIASLDFISAVHI